MTKVLIYMSGGIERYAIVAPNGVKIIGEDKPIAILGATWAASFQMALYGRLTERQFRNKWKVVGSFMVENKQ